VLGKKLDELLQEAVNLLAADKSLPQRYVDHQLMGEWKGIAIAISGPTSF
jgi:mRNA interferase YafQ